MSIQAYCAAMMARRSRSAPVPDYIPLECLITDGDQYVDTGVHLTSEMSIGVDVVMTGSTQGTYGCWMGVLASSQNYNCNLMVTRGSATNLRYDGLAVTGAFVITFGDTRHTFEVNREGTYKDGTRTRKFTSPGTFETPNTCLLFKGAGTSAMPYGSLYEAFIYDVENSVMLHRYLPYLRTADSKPGMMDVVTGDFLTNLGEGEFDYKEL